MPAPPRPAASVMLLASALVAAGVACGEDETPTPFQLPGTAGAAGKTAGSAGRAGASPVGGAAGAGGLGAGGIAESGSSGAAGANEAGAAGAGAESGQSGASSGGQAGTAGSGAAGGASGGSGGGKAGSDGGGGNAGKGGGPGPNVVAQLGPKDDPPVAKVGPSTCAAPKKGNGAKTNAIPSEFIARAYIEATGALPPQSSWNIRLASFAQNGCSAETLQTVIDLFKAPAFQALPYSVEERGSALFRAALGREIDAANLASLQKKMADDPDGWCAYVSFIEGTDSFMANVDDYCSTAKPNYHFETAAPIALHGIVGDDALQNALNGAKKGQIVELAQGVLVVLEHPVTVPAGVTLRTRGLSGEADRKASMRMARLVRGSRFEGPLLLVKGGGAIDHLFLDGRRTAYPPLPDQAMGPNVLTEPSTTTASHLAYLRSDNPAGAQNLRIGSSPGVVCTGGALVEGNLVVNSANDNRLLGSQWSDGIFTHCEQAIVRDNEILDASDVALIAFVSENGEQHSTIEDNRVLLAGNDAFGGLVVDPWTGFRCGYATCDFTGMKLSKNVLWTGPSTRFVFGISTSSAPWSFISDPQKGKLHGVTQGGSFVGNHSGESRVRLQNAIYIANMKNATVTGNWNGAQIDFVEQTGAVPTNHCGKHATIANKANASGGTWQDYAELDLTDCL